MKAKLLFDLDKLPDLWCIERCGGYFGVAIPGKTSHFYVWFDALLGYSSFSQHAGLAVDQPFTHILGKDILAFHALRLPALCAALDLPLPNPLIVHGHIVGEDRYKFSKSRGNAPSLEQVRQNWGDDVLRYYLLRNTRGTVDDISLFPESLNQCKSQLANTLGNTFRRLHKIGEHHPLQPLQGQWKQKIQEWDDKLEVVLITGNTSLYLEHSEHIIQLLQSAIQHGKWWEASQQAQAQQGYALICAVLERLVCVLPDHLGKASAKLEQGLPLDVDDVFFEK